MLRQTLSDETKVALRSYFEEYVADRIKPWSTDKQDIAAISNIAYELTLYERQISAASVQNTCERALYAWARKEAEQQHQVPDRVSFYLASVFVLWWIALILGLAPQILVPLLAVYVVAILSITIPRSSRITRAAERRMETIARETAAYRQRELDLETARKKRVPIIVQRLTAHLSMVGINDGPQPDYSQWLKHNPI